MPDLMKDRYYNYNTIHELAMHISSVYPTFPADNFIADVMDETWNALELKARMRYITINLGKYLPPDYEHALGILDKAIAGYPIGFVDSGLLYFPDFVEVYGQDERHWDLSMAALERYTQYSTAEFAVRPFIIKHEARMMHRWLLGRSMTTSMCGGLPARDAVRRCPGDRRWPALKETRCQFCEF